MSTQLDPTQLAIEFLRRDQSNLSPAQYLKRLKQLELEFADLLTLSSAELKKKSTLHGVWACIDPDLMPQFRQIDWINLRPGSMTFLILLIYPPDIVQNNTNRSLC